MDIRVTINTSPSNEQIERHIINILAEKGSITFRELTNIIDGVSRYRLRKILLSMVSKNLVVIEKVNGRIMIKLAH